MINVHRAINIFNKGGVVIFPTDTVWGIGCRLDNEEAVKKNFKIRKRQEEKAVLALVDSIEMAEAYLQPIPNDVRTKLMRKYWPGGLTIILPCKTEKVPAVARAGGQTLGVRQTSHPLLLKILKKIKVPVIAPSANFAGEKTPLTISGIDPKLISMVDFVLPGQSLGHSPSTVIDCSVKPWKIVREGEIHITESV